ncbi:MAG: YcxB family protein [Capsulimonas sp.]|uniref:YcxB family protein n=1 Tax=Capsulimonas sp. TaxID=2494211 RepID=UPI0032669A98
MDLKDYLAFYVYYFQQKPLKIAFWLLVILLMPAPLIIPALTHTHAPLPRALAIWAMFSLVILCALVFVLLVVMVLSVKQRPGTLGLFTTTITPTMLIETNSAYETQFRWEKIIQITENSRYLIFLISANAGCMIPKRSFRDAEHARAFLETARSYQNGIASPNAPTADDWPPAPQRRRVDS